MLYREMFVNFYGKCSSSVCTIWLFIQIYDGLMPQKIEYSIWYIVIFAFLISLCWFLLDGIFYNRFLRQEISLLIDGTNSKVIIRFGDLFKQDGWKVIPVNEFFDKEVDEDLVSMNSLHGTVLDKYWKKDKDDWDKQITNSLSGITYEEIERKHGKCKRYKIGTTATAVFTKDSNHKKNSDKFLFVALSKTDIYTNLASADVSELYESLTKLFKKSRIVCSADPLNIPLIGSGLAGVHIKTNIIVDLILIAIFEESAKNKQITKEIRIILPKDKKNEIHLNNILKNWDQNNSLLK